MTNAFEKVIIETGTIPKLLMTDQGKEFKNTIFNAMLQKYGIKLYHSSTSIHASHAERMIRTIFSKMARIWELKKSKAWFPYLQDVVDGINATKSSTHGFAPKDVNDSNSATVWLKLYKKLVNTPQDKPVFQPGDIVRVSLRKLPWEKGYMNSWTAEKFTVDKVVHTKPVVYTLVGVLEAMFYRYELLKVE